MTTWRHFFVIALATVLSTASAQAQDRPVVFVHGLNGGSHSWAAAAGRLGTRLAIAPHVPDLPWQETYDTQAYLLHGGGLGSLPHTTIAVGHSNGGVVARQWSTMKPLAGLLTVATPHRGALIVQRGLDYGYFNYHLYNLAGLMGAWESPENEFTWIFSSIAVYRAAVLGMSAATIRELATTLGVGLFAPVIGQMAPGSGYLGGLNSLVNVAREALTIPHRVGLVYQAHDYWRAGFAVGLFPDDREWAYAAMVGGILAFEWAGAMLRTNYPPWHATAQSAADFMFRAAWALRQLDPLWCWAVTDDGSCQTVHDGLVPASSQIYPGAVNYAVYGPAHRQQTRSADNEIASVLNHVMGVPTRGGSEQPPHNGGGGGGPDTLVAGQRLYPDQEIKSANGRFVLRYQSDGNLVLYDLQTGPLWATNTAGWGVGHAELQVDGNLVVYSQTEALWASDTAGNPGAYLKLHDNGEVVIYDGGSGVGIWWTGTGGL